MNASAKRTRKLLEEIVSGIINEFDYQIAEGDVTGILKEGDEEALVWLERGGKITMVFEIGNTKVTYRNPKK